MAATARAYCFLCLHTVDTNAAGNGNLEVTVTNPGGSTMYSYVRSLAPGIFGVYLTPAQSGTHLVNVSFNSETVCGLASLSRWTFDISFQHSVFHCPLLCSLLNTCLLSVCLSLCHRIGPHQCMGKNCCGRCRLPDTWQTRSQGSMGNWCRLWTQTNWSYSYSKFRT